VVGDAPVGAERPQLAEQRACARERGVGRRIHPAQGGRIDHARRRELERERDQIGLEDLGRGVRAPGVVLGLGPQP
jgi:hypothetical protein